MAITTGSRVPKGKTRPETAGSLVIPTSRPTSRGDVHRYQNAEDIAPDDLLIDLTERGVRDVMKRTAERAAAETGDDDYQYVSSHDLRRRFAQRLLVDRQMNPRVVMAVGGWDSFQAIEPYLNAPTADVVNDAFEEAGLA